MSALVKIVNLQRSFKVDSVTIEVLKGIDLEIKKARYSPSSAHPVLERAPCSISSAHWRGRHQARYILMKRIYSN